MKHYEWKGVWRGEAKGMMGGKLCTVVYEDLREMTQCVFEEKRDFWDSAHKNALSTT